MPYLFGARSPRRFTLQHQSSTLAPDVQKPLPALSLPAPQLHLRRSSLPRTPLADLSPSEVEVNDHAFMDIADDAPVPLSAPPFRKQSFGNSSVSYENARRPSGSSQISSRRGSNTSRRTRRFEGSTQRRSDASSQTERRTSLPSVNFRPVEYVGQDLQPLKPPAFDPSIYKNLETYSFGTPPAIQTTPGSAAPFEFQAQAPLPVETDQSAAETEETDEEERARDERAKLRAIDDGSRRPSLPINIPPHESSRDGRRSSAFKIANSADAMQIDEPPSLANATGSLPARFEPKPLPELPYTQSRTGFLRPTQSSLKSKLAASAAEDGFDLGYIMGSMDSPIRSTQSVTSDASVSGAEQEMERSPNPGSSRSSQLDSAQFQQAILDQEWGTAFTFPGGLSSRHSIDDTFVKMVKRFDPVFEANRHAWTFKKHANIILRSTKRTTATPPPQVDEEGFSPKGKERATPTESQPQTKVVAEGQLWECQAIGKYALTPGKTHLGESKRPYVLQGLTPHGTRRKGPAYLIHKHSRCHAFSIFQGFHVTGQKILASHAILLACKDVQISFANTPETRVKSTPHEPYENHPDVKKLQTHNLVEEGPVIPRPRHRGHTVHVATTPEAQRSLQVGGSRNKSQSARAYIERPPQKAGPSSLADSEVDKTRIHQLIEENSATSTSTYTPTPKVTPHAIAFNAIDHTPSTSVETIATHKLTAPKGGALDWLRRAWGKEIPPHIPPRAASTQPSGPPSAATDIAYSPPWLLMAPQSVKQEEDRIIKNLNDSFRAVGLIPPAKAKATEPAKKKQAASRSKTYTILDNIDDGAMVMLLPLWVEEGLSDTGVAKHRTPMDERHYLLVYYIPFNTDKSDLRSSTVGKKRQRGQHRSKEEQQQQQQMLRRPVSQSAMGSRSEGDSGHERSLSDEKGRPGSRKGRNKGFRVTARMFSYADVKDCGLKLPRFGLSVDAPLSDALVGNPWYLKEGDDQAVIGTCFGLEKGLELVTEGLQYLGLREKRMLQAEEQQLALQAMEDSRPGLETELSAQLEPLSPIGKSVVETILAGCISIMEHGF